MFESQFKFYSLGVAAENKKRSSMELEVTPIEILNMLDGELAPNFTIFKDDGVTGRDKSYHVEVKSANSINCTWLQLGSNRKTAPDIRRGEPIFIYRYADSDIYYWVCPGLNDELRRLETVVWAFSNTKDEKVKVIDPTNSYYLEVSTHDKHVTLHLSKNDGEPFKYTCQFNTKEGIFTLTDHDDNFIELQSKERRWEIRNKDESWLILDKREAFLWTPDLIDMQTKDFRIRCDTYQNDAKEWMTDNTEEYTLTCNNGSHYADTNFLFDAGGNFTMLAELASNFVSGAVMTIEAASIDVTGPTTFNDPVSMIQTLAVTLTATFTAGYVIGAGAGAMSASPSAMDFGTVPMTHNGKTIDSTHTHPAGSPDTGSVN